LANVEANPRTARVVAAIRPRLVEWTERGRGGIPYRTAQVMSGHGCFGEFLCWIGREGTTRCHHCDAQSDTASHTVEECPAWIEERRGLSAVVGPDLSLSALVNVMLGSERSWQAVVHFCETVISQKEDHERTRRGENAGVRRGGNSRRGRWRPPRRRGAHLRPI